VATIAGIALDPGGTILLGGLWLVAVLGEGYRLRPAIA
jgi:hypothetical protein